MSAAQRKQELCRQFQEIRRFSGRLVEPLCVEDMVVQTMADVSPTKWHLAHTSWYFETFVLAEAWPEYREFHPRYRYLFNSYYNAVGPQFSRPMRGTLSRPTVEEVMAYRSHVDRWMGEWLPQAELSDGQLDVLELGLHHEQQHQELMLTDIKHVLGCNPLYPAYQESSPGEAKEVGPMGWQGYDGGVEEIGVEGGGFCFDNEGPRHKVYLQPFCLASRLVTAGEYREFIEDQGYRRPELWLSDGWSTVQREGWEAPMYWQREGEQWHLFSLGGLDRLVEEQPVCHVSYYEADAYARWAGARLASEAEWEVAARGHDLQGHFADAGRFHPQALSSPEAAGPQQLFGDVWEWTASPYAPYPGYRPPQGAIGEYNGKFMCNQMVLRGGSCATSPSHIRATYRNFFYPTSRWQFSGIRLAKDA